MQRTKNSIINLITAFIGQLFGVAISFLTRMIFVKYLSSEYLGINGLFTNILNDFTSRAWSRFCYGI